MNLRSEIAKIRAEVDRLQTAPVAMTAPAILEASGIEPDPWQRRVLERDARQTLLLATRQGGKSTVTAAKALHTATQRPGALVLLLSPSLRQSQELFLKVVSLYRAAGEPVAVENLSALRAEFMNASRIVALPGTEKTIRGFSGVDLLIIDEAARVPDDLYFAVRPMLAVSGAAFRSDIKPLFQAA